uniref:Uncharacterized protein n=1 Tax=Eutreptiella gymnastica TaxID=73025 RepID=A0A7S1IXD8_9EUGL
MGRCLDFLASARTGKAGSGGGAQGSGTSVVRKLPETAAHGGLPVRMSYTRPHSHIFADPEAVGAFQTFPLGWRGGGGEEKDEEEDPGTGLESRWPQPRGQIGDSTPTSRPSLLRLG